MLGFNFPGDPWYGQAYALLTAKGLRPLTAPAKGAHKNTNPDYKLDNTSWGLPRITNRG